jgi:hypothetical protein
MAFMDDIRNEEYSNGTKQNNRAEYAYFLIQTTSNLASISIIV